MTKVVDTREYLNVLRELTEEGKEVSLLITGSSMSPFLIHGRDHVYFRKPDRDLKKGDIVFFQRDSGQYVMHRILRIRKDGYYLVGDGQTEVSEERAEKSSREISGGDFLPMCGQLFGQSARGSHTSMAFSTGCADKRIYFVYVSCRRKAGNG